MPTEVETATTLVLILNVPVSDPARMVMLGTAGIATPRLLVPSAIVRFVGAGAFSVT